MVDGAVRGNYGLMDQVAALHWIQENIGEFGGNADNVTVIGHGFGAACVHLLMLSPMAKGIWALNLVFGTSFPNQVAEFSFGSGYESDFCSGFGLIPCTSIDWEMGIH